jgi:16S rRNA (cytosine1402-N4)-methyltransferase
MLPEVLRHLDPRPGEIMLDVTAGCGGYSEAIRVRLAGRGLLLASDRDPEMAAVTRERLSRDAGGAPFRVFVALFSRVEEMLAEAGVPRVNGLAADLGISTRQLMPERGFSYRADGPLAMQMTPGSGLTAEAVVNRWPEEDLADVIYRYGEERMSRRIARRICQRRGQAPIRTTLELAEIVRDAFPPGRRKHHPARKVFQALRILVNDEITEVQALMAALPRILAPGARAVVVSYHSLEDRVVKTAWAQGAATGVYDILTKRVVRPSEAEVAANPSCRSGRLRAVRRRD